MWLQRESNTHNECSLRTKIPNEQPEPKRDVCSERVERLTTGETGVGRGKAKQSQSWRGAFSIWKVNETLGCRDS
jgi:hypothetical protein